MTIREATPDDYAAIVALHGAMAGVFPFPDPAKPSTMAVMVAEDDGRIVGAVMAIRAAEIVMTLDRGWRTPRMRWAMVEGMQDAMGTVLRNINVDCGYCWIPPRMRSYLRRLRRRLGWRQSDWVSMEHEL